MPRRDNRLTQLRQRAVRQPRIHLLWVDLRDTPADTDVKRDRLVAEGRRTLTTRLCRFAGKGGTRPQVAASARLNSRTRRQNNRWSQQGAGLGDPLFPIVFNNGARNQDHLIGFTPQARVALGARQADALREGFGCR
jgi:hypothetical protein